MRWSTCLADGEGDGELVAGCACCAGRLELLGLRFIAAPFTTLAPPPAPGATLPPPAAAAAGGLLVGLPPLRALPLIPLFAQLSKDLLRIELVRIWCPSDVVRRGLGEYVSWEHCAVLVAPWSTIGGRTVAAALPAGYLPVPNAAGSAGGWICLAASKPSAWIAGGGPLPSKVLRRAASKGLRPGKLVLISFAAGAPMTAIGGLLALSACCPGKQVGEVSAAAGLTAGATVAAPRLPKDR